MSKKKRNTREKTVAFDKSELSNKTSDTDKAGEPADKSGQSNGKPGGFGISRYLKTRWWAVALFAFLSLSAFGASLKYLEDDARRQMADGSLKSPNGENLSLLNSINPFLPAPVVNPTPQLAREYLYAGDRLLAVEDTGATAAPPADLAIWRPDSTNGTGTWWVMDNNGANHIALQWGADDDVPVQGDYDGDGRTDFAVFRPTNGGWYIYRSSDGTLLAWAFGQAGDKTAAADYDGDGKTDAAVFRAGWWYILRSSDGGVTYQSFGQTGDTPAAADYDGDGKADIAVWREGTPAHFYVIRSSDGQFQSAGIGQTGDIPVAADYDGDGKADYAVKSGANWKFIYSSTGQPDTISWEQAADKPVHNDYDGDGKVDIAVWRESTGYWYIRNSSNPSPARVVLWGMTGDIPVPAFYRR